MDEAVRRELKHELDEWDLGEHYSKSHKELRLHIVKEGVAQFKARSKSATFEHLKSQTFPRSYTNAIRFFFTQELQGSADRLQCTRRDTLSDIDNYGSRPLSRRYDKKNTSVVYNNFVKDKFKKVPRASLDPLERFSFTFGELSEPAVRFEQWFLCDEAAALGMVFEAVLACHAIHKEACFHCKNRNSLRWNGGDNTSWMNLVCISCNSTYEIKTKASMEKCESEYESSWIRGGSYLNYWKHRNAIEGTRTQKMFLVILPRQWTVNRSGKFVRPVTCQEIDHVIPLVKPSCFRPIKFPKLPPRVKVTSKQRERYKILPLASKVKLKKASVNEIHWFSLEKWEPPIDYSTIMEEVFINHYSREEFERLESEYFYSSHDESEKTKTKETQEESAEMKVARLKADLENMKVGNDEEDWEGNF